MWKEFRGPLCSMLFIQTNLLLDHGPSSADIYTNVWRKQMVHVHLYTLYI